MPNINFYPHPITREGHEILSVAYGQTLEEVLQLSPQQSAIAIVDGSVYDHSVWDTVVLTKDMVIQVRATVHGEDSNPLAIVLSLAVIIAAPYLAGAILPAVIPGVIAAGVTAAIQVGGILGVSYLFPPRLPSTSSQERERQYSLTGGANRARPHEPFLLLLGQHRVFPDLVAQPYTEFSVTPAFTTGVPVRPSSSSNNDYDDPFDEQFFDDETSYYDETAQARMWNQQFLFQLFDFGIGDLDIANYRIGETNLTDFQDVETEIDNHADLVAGNVDTIQGGELEPNIALVRSTAPRTNKLQYQIVSQRFRYDNNGNVVGESNLFRLEYKRQSSNAWISFEVSMATSGGEDARLPSRRIFTRDVIESAYDIRVTLISAIDAGDSMLQASAAVFVFNAHQPQSANFSGRNPYAVKIRATGQLSGRVEILSADCSQRIPVWDGSNWVVGTTSNPAWIMRKFWLGWRRPDNKLMAGRGISLDMIDDENLKRWGTFCDAMGLKCDIVIDRLMSTDDIESLIGQCGWASVSHASGKRGMVWENDDEPVTAIFNAANIVAGSVDSTYENEGLADEIVGTFIDKDSGYEENTIRRTVPGTGTPERPVDLRLKGIVDGTHAAKELNRIAAGQFYHQRIITFEVSSDGHPQYISRGSVIGLAHDLVGGSVGGRLTSINAARTVVTGTVDVPGAGIIWIWDLNGNVYSTAYMFAGGQITLMDPLPLGPVGIDDEITAYRFMAFNDNTTDPLKVRIVGIEHVGGGNFRITARDEIEQYYDARVADLNYDLLPNRNRYRPVVTPLIAPVVIGSQKWLFGMGAPAGSLGRNGDNYLDTQEFNIWRKVGGLWINVVNLAGADNAFWIVGDGVPSNDAGRDGDFYFNKLNATIWRKTGEVWISLLDIDGLEAGAVWHSDVGIPPSSLGSDGQFYYQTSNGYVWTKEDGEWVFLRDVTGPQAPIGAHGAIALRIWEPAEELRKFFNANEMLQYNGLLRAINEEDFMIRQSTGALYMRTGWPYLYVHEYILPSSVRAIPPYINNAPDGAIGLEISTRSEYLRVGGVWTLVAIQAENEQLYCGTSIKAAPTLGADIHATFFIDIGPNRGDYYLWRGVKWTLTNNVFHELPTVRTNWATVDAALAAHFDLIEASIYPVDDAELFRVADYKSGSGPINLSGDEGDVAAASDGEYWINNGTSWERAGNLLTDERISVNLTSEPTGTLVLSNTEIFSGGSVTLFWTAQNAESARITYGNNSFNIPVADLAQGNTVISNITSSTTFILTVTGKAGTTPITVQTRVTVIFADIPEIDSFTSDINSVEGSDRVTVTWRTTGAVRILLTQESGSTFITRVDSTTRLNSSETETVSSNGTNSFVLRAYNADGASVVAFVSIAWSSPTIVFDPEIDSLTISPSSVVGSGSVTVTWQTSNAVRITLEQETGFGTFTSRVNSMTRLDSSETETVSGNHNNTFKLTAYNANGVATSRSITVSWSPVSIPDPEIDSFNASPNTADVGDTITITYSTSNAIRVIIFRNSGTPPVSTDLRDTTSQLDGSLTTTYPASALISFGAEYSIQAVNADGDSVYESEIVRPN